MRLRKFVGLVVGSVTAGVVSLSALSAPAQAAAPSTETATTALTCTYGSFTINYNADLTASVDGTAVSGALAEAFTPGMPAFVTVSKFKVDLNTTIDGEAVTLTGSEDYSPSRPGNGSFAIPALTGERTGTTDPESLAITGATLTMTAMGSDSVIPCVVPPGPEPTELTAAQALSCTYGSFTINYNADLTASVDGTAVSGELAEAFTPGMPAFVTVSRLRMDLDTTIDGEAVTLTGSEDYSPSRPGNGSFAIADLAGERTATAAPEELAITGATLTMTAMGSDNTIPCVIPEPEPTELTAAQALSCTYGSFTIAYNADLAASVEGTAVSGELAEAFTPGMPAFVTVSKLQVDLDTTIDGEAVTLTGSEDYSPSRPGNGSFTLAALAGERTATTAPEELAITGATLTMTAMGSDNTIPCVIPEPEPTELTATQALTCTFQSFAINYNADLTASVDGTAVSGELAEAFTPGMPAFVTVSKLNVDLDTTIDGEAVTLTGSEDYSPSRPGNGSFAIPALAGERTATTAPEELAITGATLTMTAMGSDNTIPCVLAAPATSTATTLVATSPSAGAVNLAATVTPAAAGTVEFLRGETTVGERPVADGAASLSLTGVAAGSHSYTARFVPSDAVAYEGSVSPIATVAVAPTGPSAACVKAQGDVRTALNAVNKANTAAKQAATKAKKANNTVKRTTKAVNKAAKAVKKAKGKAKVKKAKAKLKKAKQASTKAKRASTKAKKASTKAGKTLSAAKNRHTAATNAVRSAC